MSCAERPVTSFKLEFHKLRKFVWGADAVLRNFRLWIQASGLKALRPLTRPFISSRNKASKLLRSLGAGV